MQATNKVIGFLNQPPTKVFNILDINYTTYDDWKEQSPIDRNFEPIV
jgi:hypothetical protein